MANRIAKVSIESLQEVVYEKSIGTKMKMFRGRIKVTPTIASHSLLNTSKTVRDRVLVLKDHQQETAYGVSNGHVNDDIT